MFKTVMAHRAKLVEEHLLMELKKTPVIDEKLYNAMEYSLMSGGKRIRPILLMAAVDAVDTPNIHGENFLTVASAIEMIHTYSLIHDDLPAMDDSDYRRGKLTNHKVFGEATAILAGDALLTLAFEVLTRQKNVKFHVMLEVIKELAIAAGAEGMVGGQSIDLESENKSVDLATLKKMHMGKTGAIFRASIRAGALLAHANDKQLQNLTHYAENFGLAFQITDDILDAIGDEKTVGKPIHSDEKNHKSTYVTLTSLDNAKTLANQAVQNALDNIKDFGKNADFLREIVKYLLERKK